MLWQIQRFVRVNVEQPILGCVQRICYPMPYVPLHGKARQGPQATDISRDPSVVAPSLRFTGGRIDRQALSTLDIMDGLEEP